jgi:hypothetical protein
MKDHAILIPGQLRCIDDNLFTFLDSCKTTAKIFITTDRGFEEEASLLVDRYDADLSFMDEATEAEMGISNSDIHLVHPEFIKLEVALQRLLLWEKRNNHYFKYIHRLRTDVIYPPKFDDFIKPMTHFSFSQNMLLASWAVVYSGAREAMTKLIGHTKFQIQYKTDRNFFEEVITKINVQALRDSSNAWPFMSCFPVAILGSDADIAPFHEKLKIEYPSYIDAAESFIKRLRLESVPDILFNSAFSKYSLVRCCYRRWQGSIPENIFFYYLNSLGLSTRYYSTKSPLKYARHATTSFTHKIFSQIQNNDYSFLELNYTWEEEINSFKAAGGKVPFLVQKLSYIDIGVLSDSCCQTLYKIIDILDCANWLISYSESFVNSVSARGIDPPTSLKSHLSGI